MATLLDVSLLGNFTNIFMFLFIFIVVFAILGMTKAFGEAKQGLNAMAAILVAVLVLLSKTLMGMLTTMVPWFIFTVIVIFFILFFLKMVGMKDSTIGEAVKKPHVYSIIIIVVVLIILVGFVKSFGPTLLAQQPIIGGDTGVNATNVTAPNEFTQNIYKTAFNPKVLGFIVIMLIAVFAIAFLARKPGI
ncbi:MAG: hypothetical protein ABIE94_01695 [archaeon]